MSLLLGRGACTRAMLPDRSSSSTKMSAWRRSSSATIGGEERIVLTTVTPGHDFGDQIEIVAGLHANDQVIINPPDSIVSGQQVQIVQATLPGDAK